MSTEPTTRIQFSSAGATRKNFGERKAPTLRIEFSDLLTRLADNVPANIIGEADAADLEERAEHLQQILQDVETYIAAVMKDAKYRTSGLDLDVNVLGILSDMRGDLVGTLKVAAEQMREFELEFE